MDSSPEATKSVFHARYPQTPSLENMPQFYARQLAEDYRRGLIYIGATLLLPPAIGLGLTYIAGQLAGK